MLAHAGGVARSLTDLAYANNVYQGGEGARVLLFVPAQLDGSSNIDLERGAIFYYYYPNLIKQVGRSCYGASAAQNPSMLPGFP
jgi:hypothetical protein